MDNTLLVYHGSDHIIEVPKYGKGKVHNDYGKGFYCTESMEIAKEWACSKKNDGFANAYVIDLTGLNILRLNEGKYTIFNWLALLLQSRYFDVSLPLARRAREFILDNYSVDTEGYDIIIGYRADNSYFSFAQDFLSNGISLEQLERAMHLGKLGEQMVLISERAFERIQFLENKTEFADKTIYYPLMKERDRQARSEYLDVEKYNLDFEGMFVRDIVKGEAYDNGQK